MGNKLRNLLFCPLPAADRGGFERNIMESTYIPTMAVGLVIALFEVVMIIVSLTRPGGATASTARLVYFSMYVTLLAVTLVVLALGLSLRGKIRRQPRVYLHLTYGYCFFICLWSGFLSAYSHRNSANIIVLLYTVLTVAFVVTITPWQAILMFLVSQGAFFLWMFFFLGPNVDAFSSVLNSIISTFLAIMVCSIMYHNRARNYQNRLIITRQNEEIGEINRQLSELVYIDDLTRAHNRRYFDEILPDLLDETRAAKQTVSVMMIDLDHFKEYNDIYGHQAGDSALVAFAGVVRDWMKTHEGTFFVRYGGEEFVLFLPGYDEPRGMRAAQTIRENVAQRNIVHSGSEKGYLTVSIGLRVAHPGEGTSITQLTGDADEALYIAKSSGRDRVKMFYSGGI